jgi:hypothetical protein
VEFNWIVDDVVETVWTTWSVVVDNAGAQLWMEIVGEPLQRGDLRQHCAAGVRGNNFFPLIGLRSTL